MKKLHRSVSQFNTFTKCGEQYRLERVERVPQRPAAWLAQGIAFHDAVDLWEKSGRSWDVAAVVDQYCKTYDLEIARGLEVEADRDKWLTGGRTKGSDDISRRGERGADQVQTYVAYMLQASEKPLTDFDGTPLVEWEFKLDLDGIEVIGFVDLVIEWETGAIGPRDLKTGTKVPDWPELQLGTYKVALEEIFPVEIKWGDIFMIKDGKPRPPLNLERFTKQYLTDLFHTLDESIEKGLFLPNPGDHCRVCSVSASCNAISN